MTDREREENSTLNLSEPDVFTNYTPHAASIQRIIFIMCHPASLRFKGTGFYILNNRVLALVHHVQDLSYHVVNLMFSLATLPTPTHASTQILLLSLSHISLSLFM